VLWRATVDELFVGERAELAKAHALRVAQAFYGRLQALAVEMDPNPAPGGLSVTWHASPPIGKRFTRS
jgi:hemoglobin